MDMHVQSTFVSICFLLMWFTCTGSSGQEFSSLSSGQHRLKIVPNNCGRNRRPLVVRFVVE